VQIYFRNRKITPKIPNNVVEFCGHLFLSTNRLFSIYVNSPFDINIDGDNFAALISIDFDSSTYKLVTDPLELTDCSIGHPIRPFYDAKHGVMLKCYHGPERFYEQTKIHVFRIDKSASAFHLHYSFNIPSTASYFHAIDGKNVFANTSRMAYSYKMIIGNFMWINENYSLTEMENTGVCLKPDFTFDAQKGETVSTGPIQKSV
jgi:hypothetical protein